MKKRYMSQYEAECILEARVALDSIFLGYAGDAEITEVVNAARDKVGTLYEKAFNNPDESPWVIHIKRNKRVVAWDSNNKKFNFQDYQTRIT